MSNQVSLYIIRHGETEYNRDMIMQGWGDSPLLPESIEKAIATGKGMAQDGIRFDHVYQSDLKRASDTAKYVLEGMNDDVECTSDSRLREMDFGSADVQSIVTVWTDVAHQNGYPDRQSLIDGMTAMERCALLHKVPHYSDAETIEHLNERVKSVIEDILKDASEKDYRNVLIAAHGITIISILDYFKSTHELHFSLPNSTVSKVTVMGDSHQVDFVGKVYY